MKAHTLEQWIGGITATVAIINSGLHVIEHIRKNKTKLWLCTVRILGVVPIYAAISFAGLMMETSEMHWAELLNFVREVYEAVAILSFIQFILNFLGGPQSLADTMEEQGGEYTHKCPCLGSWKRGPQFVYKTIGNIIQYLYVMLFVFIANLIIWSQEREILKWGVHYVRYVRPVPNILKSMSAMWALYNLGVFYHELHDELRDMNAIWKFMSIKGIVFFTFWQGVVISVFVALDVVPDQREDPVEHLWSQTQIADGIRNLLLCVEMLVFSQMHRQAYQVEEMNKWLQQPRMSMLVRTRERASSDNYDQGRRPERLVSMVEDRQTMKVVQFQDLGELNAQLRDLRDQESKHGGAADAAKGDGVELQSPARSDDEQQALRP